jgi:hypothetical protein
MAIIDYKGRKPLFTTVHEKLAIVLSVVPNTYSKLGWSLIKVVRYNSPMTSIRSSKTSRAVGRFEKKEAVDT